MEIIIDFDSISDSSKKEWLLRTLQLMNISFHTAEKSQSAEEYNQDLESGNNDIDRGEFITAVDLKKEAANGSYLE